LNTLYFKVKFRDKTTEMSSTRYITNCEPKLSEKLSFSLGWKSHEILDVLDPNIDFLFDFCLFMPVDDLLTAWLGQIIQLGDIVYQEHILNIDSRSKLARARL
jgi:hypothetical protein